MKIFIIAQKGESFSLATRLKEEGNDVSVYVPQNYQGASEFPFETTHNWRGGGTSSDIVIFDSPGMGGVGSQLRKQGRVVLNGGRFADLLSEDFELQSKVSSLIKLPQYNGKEGDLVLLEGWFNGTNFLKPLFISFPKCRLMEGCKGPITPGMGTTLTTVEGGVLYEKTLGTLKRLLESSKYLGVFGVLLNVTNEEVEFVNFKVGFSYDSLQAQGELLKCSWTSLLEGLQSSESNPLKIFRGKWVTSIRLSLPPYPMRDEFPTFVHLEVPIGAEKHLWHYSPEFEGVVGSITAWGDSVRESSRRAYRTIEKMHLYPEVQWRSDLSSGVELAYTRLRTGGLI